jgi:hypothetical protein
VPSKSRLLQDIRFLESSKPADQWSGPPASAGAIFTLPKEAGALGQRLGKKCGELGMSIGYGTHLYLCFNTAAQKENIVLTDFTMAAWQRYVSYSLSAAFNDCTDELKLCMLVDATLDVLAYIATPAITSREWIKREVMNESLLLLVKSKRILNYDVTIFQTIPVHPRRAEVFAHVLQIETGHKVEVKIGETDSYHDVPGMVDRISISKGLLTVLPRKSLYLNAQLTPVNIAELF